MISQSSEIGSGYRTVTQAVKWFVVILLGIGLIIGLNIVIKSLITNTNSSSQTPISYPSVNDNIIKVMGKPLSFPQDSSIQNSKQVMQTVVVRGKVFDFSFEYDPKLGKVIDKTSAVILEGEDITAASCREETVSFSNSPISLNFFLGWQDCPAIGGYPGNTSTTTITDRDGKQVELSVITNIPVDNNSNSVNIRASVDSGNIQLSSAGLHPILMDLFADGDWNESQINDLKSEIIPILKSFTFKQDIKSNNFDVIKRY